MIDVYDFGAAYHALWLPAALPEKPSRRRAKSEPDPEPKPSNVVILADYRRAARKGETA